MLEKIILASSSPRRRELIEKFALPCEIVTAETEEVFNPERSVEDNLIAVAVKKSEAAAKKRTLLPGEVLISADTIVCLDGEVIKKPRNEEDALNILTALSGRTHEVISGVSVSDSTKNLSFTETTYVKFAELSQKEILSYIATKEPMDKAGAYGIQGTGALFIEKIDGCYYNVMGLPVAKLYRVLVKLFGYTL